MAGDSRQFQEAMKRGSAHAWAGRWEKAAEEYGLALREFPEDVPARTHLAMALYRSGQLATALDLYHGLWRAQPSNLALLQRVAELQETLGQRLSAAESYLVVAEVHRRRRSLGDALKAWRKVVGLKPGDPELWDRAMDVAAEVGSVADLIPGYLGLARSLATAGRFEDAIRIAERAQILDPTNPAVPQLLSGIRKGLQYSWRAAEMGEEPTVEDLQRLIPPVEALQPAELRPELPLAPTSAAEVPEPAAPADLQDVASSPASVEAVAAPDLSPTLTEEAVPPSVPDPIEEEMAPVEESQTPAPEDLVSTPLSEGGQDGSLEAGATRQAHDGLPPQEEEIPRVQAVDEEPAAAHQETEALDEPVTPVDGEGTSVETLRDALEAEAMEPQSSVGEEAPAAAEEVEDREAFLEGILEYVGSAETEAVEPQQVEPQQEEAAAGTEPVKEMGLELVGGTAIAEQLVERAEAQERLGQTEQAAGFYEQALGLDPDLTRAYLGMARLHLSGQRLDAAEEEARNALQASAPTEVEMAAAVELLLASCGERFATGDLGGAANGLAWLRSQAVSDRLPATAVESVAVESVELLGQCVGEHLEEIVLLAPEARQEVILGLRAGEEHLRTGRLRSAVDEMYRIVNGHPGFLPAQSMLGRVLVARGKLDDARDRSRQLVRLYEARAAAWQGLEVLWWTVAQGIGDGNARAQLVSLLRDRRRFSDAELVGSADWGARPVVPRPPSVEQPRAEDRVAEWAPGVSFRVLDARDEPATPLLEKTGLSFEQRLRQMLGIGEAAPGQSPDAEGSEKVLAELEMPRVEAAESMTTSDETAETGKAEAETQAEAAELRAAEGEALSGGAQSQVFEGDGLGETAEVPEIEADAQEESPEAEFASGIPPVESAAAEPEVESRPWDNQLRSAEAGFASGDLEGAARLVLEVLQSDRVADDATWAALVRVLQLLGRDDVRDDLVEALRHLGLPEGLADR